MDDILKEFLAEASDIFNKLEADFMEIEKAPTDPDLIGSIFRGIHTIKGTGGCLGFSKLEKLAHAGENLLSKIRDKAFVIDKNMINTLLEMLDDFRVILSSIANQENDGSEEYLELIARLTKLCDGPSAGAATPPVITVAPVPEAPLPNPPAPIPEIKVEVKVAAPAPEVHAPAAAAVKASPAAPSPAVVDSSIRVDIALLDRLMNLVGELVLARNQILQFNKVDPGFLTTSQRLNLITTELQESVMKTRMQPIYNIWSKFPRVVRDLAQSLGKSVEVIMEGKDTELDKSIIENIKDPLMHLVRNTVDHGIENAEVRKERGKPETGSLILKAYHEGGLVNIEIIDDGGGINLEAVKKKAVEKGLYSADKLSTMSESEIIGIIFMAGFSTAEKITNVSGRGVGMDVVKTNIEKIGGAIDIQSSYTKGMTIKIKIPLTLAIIPALVVNSAGDDYAIPQVNLVELVLLEDKQVKQIEFIQDVPVYRLRGKLLPLVAFDKVFGISDLEAHVLLNKPEVNIVVLMANDRQFGLVVDHIKDTQEIVVKPLGKLLKGIDAFAGATIMGDGTVALILDTLGIAKLSNLLEDNSLPDDNEQNKIHSKDNSKRQSMLLLQSGAHGQMAVLLSLVSRLEEFKFHQVEYSGNLEVVQYREQIMPLLRLSKILSHDEAPVHPDFLQVVVYSHHDHNVGIVVDNIVDIVSEELIVDENVARPGVLGSAVVHNKVTEILDLAHIIEQELPDYFCKEECK
jgi:two-component system, chemotaxis family, sensor kinase CheA